MTSASTRHVTTVRIDAEALAALRVEAAAAPTKRARICLHASHTDAVQEMVIALLRGTLVRPHRHPGRCESLHAIEGRAVVVIFDDDGGVIDHLTLAPLGQGDACMIRFGPRSWHTVVPMTDTVIVHEVAQGPFDATSSEYASWAPAAGDALAQWLERVVASQ